MLLTNGRIHTLDAAGSVVDVLVSVQITPPGGAATTVFSLANSNDKHTYQGPPAVNSVSPNAGATAGGYDVKINGSSFSTVTNAATVKVGSTTLNCPAACTVTITLALTGSAGER